MPFKLTAATFSAAAGTPIAFTLMTAEPQSGWPQITVKQPGLAVYRVSSIKYSTTKFKFTLKMKAGTPGVVKLTITGTDVNGGVDVRTFDLTLTP
jgi:hypothetical protein